jgi:hypothetical protein
MSKGSPARELNVSRSRRLELEERAHATGRPVGRSKLFAITARTPSSAVPLAAQSREEPVPYSSPAITTRGTLSRRYSMAAS